MLHHTPPHYAAQSQRLTDLIGIISRFVLKKKVLGGKNVQPTGSTSEEQAVLVGHDKQTGAFPGQLLRGVKDPHLLQGPELKILLGDIKKRSVQGKWEGQSCLS